MNTRESAHDLLVRPDKPRLELPAPRSLDSSRRTFLQNSAALLLPLVCVVPVAATAQARSGEVCCWSDGTLWDDDTGFVE